MDYTILLSTLSGKSLRGNAMISRLWTSRFSLCVFQQTLFRSYSSYLPMKLICEVKRIIDNVLYRAYVERTV